MYVEDMLPKQTKKTFIKITLDQTCPFLSPVNQYLNTCHYMGAYSKRISFYNFKRLT